MFTFSKLRPGWMWDQQSLLPNAYREFIRWVNWPECGDISPSFPRHRGVVLNQLHTKVLILFYVV